MNDLEETRALLKESIRSCDTHVRNMQELLIKSEERIGATNAMVSQLANIIAELKMTFEHHIDQAIRSRDHVQKQNNLLIQRLTDTEAELKKERDKYDALMQQLLDCMMNGKIQGTSVNVNQR